MQELCCKSIIPIFQVVQTGEFMIPSQPVVDKKTLFRKLTNNTHITDDIWQTNVKPIGQLGRKRHVWK